MRNRKATRMFSMTISVLLAAQGVVSAADFRGVKIGDSCRRAAEVEVSLGARPQADIEEMVRLGIVAFEDQSVAGRHTRFLYSCPEAGVVSRYSITVRVRGESQARAIYAEAKAAAVGRVGTPSSDSSAPTAADELKRSGIPESASMREFAVWNSVEGQNVILTLEVEADGEWSIATFVAAIRPNVANKPTARARGQ
jgi:hypothetical protein